MVCFPVIVFRSISIINFLKEIDNYSATTATIIRLTVLALLKINPAITKKIRHNIW
jgi:hypothetical protein